MSALSAIFSDLEDPRAANCVHRLGDVLVIALAAALCGQTRATEIALFAELRRETLNRLVAYERAPSHDPVSRLLRLVDPAGLGAALTRFAEAFAAAAATRGGPDVVAMDGKALRRAVDGALAHAPPMTVSAFAAEARLTLAATSGASEAEALKAVVELLDLTGKIVTADALHCDHATAEALTAKGADYVLGLKRNRPAWHEEAEALFAAADPEEAVGESRGHGRRERRAAAVLAAPRPRAAGHAAYGRVVAQRDGGAPATRYFLLSRRFQPETLLAIARAHWLIETALHSFSRMLITCAARQRGARRASRRGRPARPPRQRARQRRPAQPLRQKHPADGRCAQRPHQPPHPKMHVVR